MTGWARVRAISAITTVGSVRKYRYSTMEYTKPGNIAYNMTGFIYRSAPIERAFLFFEGKYIAFTPTKFQFIHR